MYLLVKKIINQLVILLNAWVKHDWSKLFLNEINNKLKYNNEINNIPKYNNEINNIPK